MNKAGVGEGIHRTTLGQYYTSSRVSEILVAAMDADHGVSILDLGAGNGQLTRAALTRWQPSSLITVELDNSSVLKQCHVHHQHIQGDALDVDLPNRIKKLYGEFDVAVCNPPYIRPSWRPDFRRILEEAGLGEVCPVFQDVRAEILFLAQNLRMTRDGGQIGLVVPDGPITGERCTDLRRHLLARHAIKCVISLPRNVFSGTEARAHIIVLRKSVRDQKQIALLRLSEQGELSSPIHIDPGEAVFRMDYEFHRSRIESNDDHLVTLREIGASIVRGRASSINTKTSIRQVFHTSSFREHSNWAGISLPRSVAHGDLVELAIPGDILVARVDRKLETKICRVRSGAAQFSDCIFRVRVSSAWSQKVFSSLTSSRGSAWLSSHARGVGARYITRQTLLDFGV